MKNSLDVITKIDFETFGIKPKGELLHRASKVLSDLFTSGDLYLQSAWLYYGSMTSAAKALGIPITDYRIIAKGQGQFPRNIYLAPSELRYLPRETWAALLGLPKDAFYTIIEGAYMLMEMAGTERSALFPKKHPLPLIKDVYIKSVKSWRKIQVETWGADKRGVFPVEAAYGLLAHYVEGQRMLFKSYGTHTKGWQIKHLVPLLIEGHLHRPLPIAIKFRDRIKDAATISELYAVALDIIHEYEIYCLHKSEINKHVKAQRRIMNSKREGFRIALEKRDGALCKHCRSVQELRIDHIKPVSLGGLSELENLQLLCALCNGIKGDRPMDYLLRRTNKWRKLAIK